MKKYLRSKWVVPAILILMGIGTYFYYQNKYQPQVEQGEKFENIVAPSRSGEMVSLYDIKNKIVLIQFWASWCGPCIHELPDLKNIYSKYHNQSFTNANGFDVMMFSLDFDTLKWNSAIERFELNDLVHVNERAMFKSPTAQRLGINAIPTNILIDPQHNVIGVDLDMQELEKTLRRFSK